MGLTDNSNNPNITNVPARPEQNNATDTTEEEIARQISTLQGHFILCGGGRTTDHIIERFWQTGIPLVLVDHDFEVITRVKALAAENNQNLLCMQGDATEDDVLEQAGITRAEGLIAVLHDDKENLFVILTARSLNPTVRIVTRVNDEQHNREKMIKAGADRVISTSAIGGLRMASEMIRPEVVKFLDQMLTATEKEKTLRFTEVPLTKIKMPVLAEMVKASSGADEEKIRVMDIGKHTGLLVVAVKTHGAKLATQAQDEDLLYIKRSYRFAPKGDMELHNSDILVVIGTQDKLDEVMGNN